MTTLDLGSTAPLTPESPHPSVATYPRLPLLLQAAGLPALLIVIGVVSGGNEYFLHLATAAAIAYVLTAAFNLIYGYAGVFNLSIIIVYGLGAFTSVYAETQWGISFWLATLAAILVSALVSVLIALPSSALGELFLAIQTLACALALSEVLAKWTSFTGGTTGIYLIPAPTFFGTTLISGQQAFYWMVAALTALVSILMVRVHRSGLGRQLIALREGPRVLASVGVSPAGIRLVAFGLSGALAGLAGSAFAHFQLVIDLESFSFTRLVALLLATILGGAGYLYGPLIGVLVLVAMDELSLATSQAQDLIYGVGVIALVWISREGVAGAVSWLYRQVRGRITAANGDIARATVRERRAVDPDLLRAVVTSHLTGGAVSQLRIDGARVDFGGTVALAGVDCMVNRGEVVGLIGPNGAGKTTLLNTITGDVALRSGTVMLDRTSLVGLARERIVRLGVSRTFQSPKIIPDLTLLQNLELVGDGAGAFGWMAQLAGTRRTRQRSAETRQRAWALLNELQLADRAGELAGSQPYGVQRLVEVARNLMLAPAFLLLDEPGAGLTDREREEVAEVIRALGKCDIGVVLIDHNIPLITAACDRVYVLDAGRLLAEGSPSEVLARDDVRTAYLGASE